MTALCVVAVTLACPLLGILLSLLGVRFDFRNWRIYIICISLTLAVMAYYYVPTADSDITRYFQWVELYSRYDFSYLIDSFFSGRQSFIAFSILCWFMGHYANMHLLPAFVVFTVFLIAQYITCKTAEDYKIPSKYTFAYIILILLGLGFYHVTNNIRNILAFSLIGLGVFRDVYQKKRDPLTYILYVIAFFLHSSSIALICLRFVLKYLKKTRKFALAFVVLASPILRIAEFFIVKIPSGNPVITIVKNMVVKGSGYYTHVDADWAVTASKSGAVIVLKLLYLTLIALFTIVIYPILKKNKIERCTSVYDLICRIFNLKLQTEQGELMYFEFVFYLFMMTFACIPMVMPEYWRFASVALVMGGPLYLHACVSDDTPVIGVRLTNLMLGVAALCCVLWFRDMYLYSDIVSMYTNTLFNSPVLVVIKNILKM